MNIKQAAKKWVDDFNFIPGKIFKVLIKVDESVSYFDSDIFRLVASPTITCSSCGAKYEGKLKLKELQESSIKCEYCNYNDGDSWGNGYPEYAFPCGWGTLFNPKESLDQEWIEKNAEKVTECGIFVFESDIFGILLGIDGGGYDFYESHWIPLYKARGLEWHNEE